MTNWVPMFMRRLGGGRKYSNLNAAARAGGRFHPNIGRSRTSIIRRGDRTSIISGGESLVPSGKSPLPLLLVPPEMLTDMGGDASSHYYNFMRIEKQHDDCDVHKKLIMLEKSIKNKLPWEKLLLPDNAICRGSSHGWLAFVHPNTQEVGLFNPFILPKINPFPYIPLPRSNTISNLHCRLIYKADYLSDSPSVLRERYFNCYILQKLALSCAPVVGGGYEEEKDDCDVVAISEYHDLVFCKLGDSAWINLKGSFDYYSDVIYFSKHGRFYAVPRCEDHYYIESWDFRTDPCSPQDTLIEPCCAHVKTDVFPCNPQSWRAEKTSIYEDGVLGACVGRTKRYLVEASGELLLVLRLVCSEVDKDGFLIDTFKEKDRSCDSFHDDDELTTEITVGFDVYRMDWTNNRWEPVESLGDKALFLGLNHSFSVSTHDLPQVMQNCIYFTDDRNVTYSPQGYDSGVYNMKDGFISGILPSSLEKITQHPVWVLPNPN